VRRIGLIVNPIAGIGGPLAGLGSDHFVSIEEAIRSGGKPVAAGRTERALRRLLVHAPHVQIVALTHAMGGAVALGAGFDVLILDEDHSDISKAEDTRTAAAAMIEHGVSFILFAGGDGTARDIFDAVSDRMPIIGIPTGVKMHSAVFALSPEAAGETAGIALKQDCKSRPAEIMDSDSTMPAEGRPSFRLFGCAATPSLPRFFQSAKGSRPDGGEAAIEALGRKMAREARPGRPVILGPGTTMAAIKRSFGLAGTLMGVDAILDGKVIAENADAGTLETICREHLCIALFVGIVGGQGFLFGRGNQQISPTVIHKALEGDFRIIGTREKLMALPSRILHVDTGDIELDRVLEGYRRVETGPNDSMMMPVNAGL
jgi:predicted polyphosphate/ATP-dependent NAD kinase